MKANELRIGNLVDGQPFTFDIQEIESLGVGSAFFKNGGLEYRNINPIPLTEEWLLKFGFENRNGFNRYERGFIGVILDDNSCVDMHDTYNEVWSVLCLIKSVHQLQNLYFALTGEELTIKE